MTRHYDSAIIGAGQAAPALAVALAGRGEQVAVVEGHLLGGTCVNVGCTPTKTLRKSARVAHLARRAADFGVNVGEVSVDFGAAMARMRARADTSRAGLQSWLEGTDGVDVISGWGAFEGREGNRFVVRAGEQMLSADKVYLNTGTRAFTPPIAGLEEVAHLDNVSLLALTEMPQHLIIVGGSYIGLEMGQIFRRLGSEVTVINHGSRLAGREDADISAILQEVFESEGVRIVNNASILRAENTDSGVALILADDTRVEGSHIMFATGRSANSERLNLAAVGVETDALYQWQGADQRTTTYAMFTDPPLGHTGMSLADAQQAANEGCNILVAERAMSNVSRAREESETTGLIRLIVDGDSEQILGATVFGFSGDEVIAVLSNYMATGAGYRQMQQALPVHPTVAELLPTVLGTLERLDSANA